MSSQISINGIHKFGANAAVGTLFVPIVDTSAVANAFPLLAAPTTIVSDSIADTAGSTGARTVDLFGIDGAGHYIMETVTLDGTTVVLLTKEFRMILRGFVMSAGSSTTNLGRIQILHGASVIAAIAVGHGQTQILAWYFADDSAGGKLGSLEMHVSSISTVTCDYNLIVLTNGVERVQHLGQMTSDNPSDQFAFGFPLTYFPRDLIFMEARVSAGTKPVDGSFGIHMN